MTRHIDPSELADMAFGHAPAGGADDAVAHLGVCASCREQLDSLRRVVRAARSATPSDVPSAPAPRVWHAIASELGLADDVPAEPESDAPAGGGPAWPDLPSGPGTDRGTEEDPADDAGAAGPVPAGGDPARPERWSGTGADRGDGTADDGAPATPTPTPAPTGERTPGDDATSPPAPREGLAVPGPRRDGRPPARPGVPRARRRVALALAAALVVGGLGGSGVTYWQTREETRPPVSAATTLATEGDGRARGTARLDADARTVTVDVSRLPSTDGYFEVWLMDSTHTKLISLGVLSADGKATLPLPQRVDTAEYSLVDVSDQAFNGSPAHSGDSVVRGPLPTLEG